MLLRKCLIIEDSLEQTTVCLEKCGYGEQLQPCITTAECHCAGHNAQRLRDETQSLYILIMDGEDKLHEARYAATQEELHILKRLRHLLEKAKATALKCSSRASLFDALGSRICRNKQVEKPQRHTIANTDSASSALPKQQPYDSETEPKAEEQHQKDTSQAEAETPPWQCYVESCSRADSSTSHNVMNYIGKAFGKAAAVEAAGFYKLKAICWHGGTKRVLVNLDGQYLRLRPAI